MMRELANSKYESADALTERGHPVRQRAQHAQLHKGPFHEAVRASRSGGQDVRAPLPLPVLTSITTQRWRPSINVLNWAEVFGTGTIE
jgi:hypothetical protein